MEIYYTFFACLVWHFKVREFFVILQKTRFMILRMWHSHKYKTDSLGAACLADGAAE